MKKLKASELMAEGQTNCYWCRRNVVPFNTNNQTAPLGATIDHVRGRPECTGFSEWNNRKNKVLACYECNQRRSKEWSDKFQAGLVFRTAFAERSNFNYKNGQAMRMASIEIQRMKQQDETRKRNMVKLRVPMELSAAFECQPIY